MNNTSKVYLLKLSNRNARKVCERCSKLTIKTPEKENFSWEKFKI